MYKTCGVVLGYVLIVLVNVVWSESSNDLLQQDQFLGNKQTESDRRLEDYISQLQAILSEDGDTEALQVAARLDPMTSDFLRGKKAAVDILYNSPDRRRLNLDQFYSMRGRRTPPTGFFGSRGKRDFYTSPSKRQPPSGFIVSRGKKDIPFGFFGSRGKKARAPPGGFYMPRGKKADLDQLAIATRGRRVHQPPSGFFGSRGKKSVFYDLPEVGSSNTYELPELYHELGPDLVTGDLVNHVTDLGYVKRGQQQSNSESKREPPRGFLPLRG